MSRIPLTQPLLIKSIYLVFSLYASTVFSNEKNSGKPDKENITSKKVGKLSSVNAYFGFGAGAISSISDDENKEFSKSGYSLGLSGVFSKKTPSLIIDGIVGWRNSRVFIDKDKEFVGEKDLEVRADYVHLDLAPMFKLSNKIWAGPLLSATLGTDTTFSPKEEHTRPNYYIGAQSNFYAGKQSQHRINLQLKTDIAIQGRQIFLFNINYHIGMELFDKPKYVVKTVYKKSKPVIVKETKVEEINKYQFLLDGGIINFATGQHTISPKYRQYLADLANFLKSNDSRWNLIFVRSHTDYRGGVQLNQMLSKNRANAVISFFQGQNIASEKIKVHSNSFNDPVEDTDDQVSLAKNRRVEIIIVSRSSRDAVRLNQQILNIKQRNRIPTTCLDGVCR